MVSPPQLIITLRTLLLETSFITNCEFRASSESNLNSTLAKEDAEAENQEGKVMRVVVGVLSSKMRGVQNNPKGDDL